MKLKIALIALIGFFFVHAACASGGSELTPYDGSAAVRPAETGKGAPLTISAFVITDTENRSYTDGMYVPMAAAAFLPTSFSVSAKDRRLAFDHSLPYRVLSRSTLKGDVVLYALELPAFVVDFKGKRYDESRTYTFAFPRGALGKPGGVQTQPSQYAIERAIRIASVSDGLARIESLRYDEASEIFKASVVVAAQSIKR